MAAQSDQQEPLMKALLYLAIFVTIGTLSLSSEIYSYEKKPTNSPLREAMVDAIMEHYNSDGSDAIDQREFSTLLRDLHELIPPPHPSHHGKERGHSRPNRGSDRVAEHGPRPHFGRGAEGHLLHAFDQNKDEQLDREELSKFIHSIGRMNPEHNRRRR